MQRYQIFCSRYSVKSKMCNLFIDNENCKNIISRALMDYLKLETEMLVQRPITLVLMMSNSCSYSTNYLVFIKFQILAKILVDI